eukprot:m.137769 g.137769  ORF g.137769 m.137769 type:complete len:68 (+) comp29945_c0_seq1:910-1113(+)
MSPSRFILSTLVPHLLRAQSFSELSMWDETMHPIHPTWSATSEKPCGGSVTLDATKNTITIEHNSKK